MPNSDSVILHSDVAMTALVTGASSGIGLEFCHQLASMGINLLMVSNQMQELANARDTLAAKYPDQRFWAHYKDLAHPDAADEIYAYCSQNGIVVDILINNAGIFSFKTITDTTTDSLNLFIDLHMRTVTQLCQRFAIDMKSRRSGYILNMSSMSCWMPMPGIGMYAATKAYIRVFSRSLALELKDYGVGVTVACPGGIATDLFGLPRNLQRLGVKLGVLATPQRFVSGALKRMFNHKKQYINGFINRLAIVAVALLPDSMRLIVKHKLLDKNGTK
ncbi:MAG: SDR family NAD(P)-dependent oxidoreductase [Bacteroidales bacterium]|nr:SDR family NAD(P)-dependent oxidoreductase [Bacteroidales bacterium]